MTRKPAIYMPQGRRLDLMDRVADTDGRDMERAIENAAGVEDAYRGARFPADGPAERSKLYDRLLVALADPQRRLADWNPQSSQQRVLLHDLNKKLIRATRFELAPDFTELAGELSLIEPRKLAYLYSHARAPYDLMWIEWAPRDRERGIRAWAAKHTELDIADAPATIDGHAGILIERDTRWGDRKSIYRSSYFTADRTSESIAGWPIGLVYDPEGAEVESCKSAQDIMVGGLLHAEEKFTFLHGLGPGYLGQYGSWLDDNEFKIEKRYLLALGYMRRSAGYALNSAFGLQWLHDLGPYMLSATNIAEDDPDYSPDLDRQTGEWIRKHLPPHIKPAPRIRSVQLEAKKIIGETLAGGAGDLRWIGTLLGLMNTYEVVASPPQQIEGQKLGRVIGLKRVPYLEYRRLSLVLPKSKPVEYRIKKLTDSMIRHRRHQVRGFYRTLKPTAKRPEKRVWVLPHERGDASLGWVIKTYHVEKNPDEDAMPAREVT